LSTIAAKQITEQEFQDSLKAFEDNPFVVRYTIMVGWGLMQSDAYTSIAGPITGKYWKLIATINIEVEQLQGVPREIYLWINLPPLESDKNEKPEAPMKVDIRKSSTGKSIPTFMRSVDPRLPLMAQLAEFAREAQLYYTVNCEQQSFDNK
jgi:hypothetical protein